MRDLPDAAVTAAAVHLALLRGQRDEPIDADRRVARNLLTAALPHLTAAATAESATAERERILVAVREVLTRPYTATDILDAIGGAS